MRSAKSSVYNWKSTNFDSFRRPKRHSSWFGLFRFHSCPGLVSKCVHPQLMKILRLHLGRRRYTPKGRSREPKERDLAVGKDRNKNLLV